MNHRMNGVELRAAIAARSKLRVQLYREQRFGFALGAATTLIALALMLLAQQVQRAELQSTQAELNHLNPTQVTK